MTVVLEDKVVKPLPPKLAQKLDEPVRGNLPANWPSQTDVLGRASLQSKWQSGPGSERKKQKKEESNKKQRSSPTSRSTTRLSTSVWLRCRAVCCAAWPG